MDQQPRALARKYRPQRFDDVVGQQAVTRTLQNAIKGGNLAQSFVFAGPRGVGKTTTARILARALNCDQGPTVEPCGRCDACVEIAVGRDMDVLEIDAATHTGVDNVREVIIDGLSTRPVRDRFKVFIIDEVHQLSKSSFNALLKSVEEPPPHVVFIMATTELDKVIDTILSRSQVFEFKAIGTREIGVELARVAKAEGIDVTPDALALIARSASGSMRDGETALDQVRAFAGERITVEEVSAALGLVGRDLVFDIVEAVAEERALAAFELPARAVERGYDLKGVCQELSRLVRDLMVVSIDPARIDDPEIAADTERQRLIALAGRFSREDLLRAFDLLTKAEYDIRNASVPKYHLEMVMLRWMHARKLVPLTDLIERLQKGGGVAASPASRPAQAAPAGRVATGSAPPAAPKPLVPPAAAKPTVPTATPAPPASRAAQSLPPPAPAAAPTPVDEGEEDDLEATGAGAGPSVRDALLDEIKKTKAVFYRMVVAQAQRVDVSPDQVTLTFSAAHRLLGEQVEQNRPWLEALGARIMGRKPRIVVATPDGGEGAGPFPDRVEAPAGGQGAAATPIAGAADGGEAQPRPADGFQQAASSGVPAAGPSARPAPSADLKARLLASPPLKALTEVFPIEIRDIEEL